MEQQKKRQMCLIYLIKSLMVRNNLIPPIGLYPKKLFLEDRLNDINSAILRYIEADYLIPSEWISERDYIITVLQYGEFKKNKQI